MKYSKQFNNRKLNEDEEELEIATSGFCGYFKSQRAISKLVVPIDEPFKEARYYRMVCDAIRDLGEEEVVS